MRVIALIDEADVIRRILRHLGLWEEKPVTGDPAGEPLERPPPTMTDAVTYEPFYDHLPFGDDEFATA